VCSFFARPRKTITKSEYTAVARGIGKRAAELGARAKELRNEENAGGRTRKWRARTKALGKDLSTLEDDEAQLEKCYPQARVSCCQRLLVSQALKKHTLAGAHT
jgi:hypothetical protein